jgi:hypothetical protein
MNKELAEPQKKFVRAVTLHSITIKHKQDTTMHASFITLALQHVTFVAVRGLSTDTPSCLMILKAQKGKYSSSTQLNNNIPGPL